MRSDTFCVSRLILARLAFLHYLRLYWWFASIIPFAGIVGLCISSGIMQAISFLAVLWPFTLPARSVVASRKASPLLRQGVWVLLENDALYFHGPNETGFKLELTAPRTIFRFGDYLLVGLRTRGHYGTDHGFVPIYLPAFGEQSLSFESLVRKTCTVLD